MAATNETPFLDRYFMQLHKENEELCLSSWHLAIVVAASFGKHAYRIHMDLYLVHFGLFSAIASQNTDPELKKHGQSWALL